MLSIEEESRDLVRSNDSNFEMFEQLPLDIKKEIFEMSNITTITNEYYNSMMNFRESRCMRDISIDEINKAVSEGSNIIVNDYTHMYMVSLSLSNTIGCVIPIMPSSRITINENYDYSFKITFHDYNNVFIDLYKTKNGKKSHSRYFRRENIFPTVTTLKSILLRRGSLCYKHQKKIILDFIIKRYNQMELKLFSLWIILSSIEMNIFDKSMFPNAFENKSMFSISVEILKEYIPTYIQYVIDNL